MANTISSKKAVRSSARKGLHNLFWKEKVKNSLKRAKALISGGEMVEAAKEFSLFQKLVDKARKEKVIHTNKANRLKSKYAKKLTVQAVAKPASKKRKQA